MRKFLSLFVAALFGLSTAATAATAYYVNMDDWTAVKAYMWADGNQKNAEWPGVAMTKTAEQALGHDIWSYEVPDGFVDIIFNNGSDKQTGNLKFDASKPYCCSGQWFASKEAINPVTPKFYITGESLVGSWSSNALQVLEDSYTFTNKPAGNYSFKVTEDGTWATAKGYSALTNKEGFTADGDDNVCFTLAAASDIKVTYTKSPAVFTVEITAVGGGGGGSSTGFYITGDSALVVDAGIGIGKKWNPDALKVEKDTAELSLKAAVTYTLKVTTAGTWETAKGFSDLTEAAKGLWKDKDNNICFALTAAGVVKVIYKTGVFKLEGAFDESKVPATPTLENGYYLIGQNGWDESVLSESLKFAANPDTEGEFQLSATLVKDQEIKVVSVESNAIKTWYPDGMGNAYKVDADHAGAKTIFFRPAGNDDWKTFHEGGFFFVAANEGGGGGGGETPDPQFDGKFYITGESLVGSWEPNALACENSEHTFTALAAGDYKFKITVDGTWATAKGFSDLASRPKGVTEGDNNNICFTLAAAGNVTVKFNGSKITLEGTFDESKEITFADGYYLIGQNGWSMAALNANLKFEANAGNEGEYKLEATLVVDQEIKVVLVENSTIKTWFPDGMDNAYKVDAAHAGAKTIFFRPAGNAEWETFSEGGFIFIEENSQAIDNTADGVKAVKVLRDGQLMIIKGEKTYNVIGAQVK
ncbi:MAG: starch-binding protein [Paludibacteraceae bacterium]|nr:starch-binding protein [Paludibacteraceae bacterium]